jgi:hypothetical protein
VRGMFVLGLGGACMFCTMEGIGGGALGAEYVWPNRRRYVVLYEASCMVLIYL